MEYSLKNKVVIVTGGVGGIGLKIVEKYLEQEAKIAIIVDINETLGMETVKTLNEKYGEGKSEFIKCDVTTDLEIVTKTIFDKHKTIDVLTLNAGITDPSVPRRMFDILATSVIEWSLKFLGYMRKDENGSGGTILINSSIFGYKTIPHAPVYQASKFAVLGLTKSLGHEYNFNKTGVRVLAICPGFTKTLLSLPLYDPELKRTLIDEDLITFVDAHSWQEAETVGEAAVKVFKKAKSGTIWAIEGGILSEIV